MRCFGSWGAGTIDVYLETERLLLRRFTGADAENLHALDGDPEVMRFLDDGRPKSRETVEAETLPILLRSYERSAGLGVWATVGRSSGEFVGWFALQPAEGEDPEEVELGYRLRRSAWGKGYATEGSQALIRKAFTELGVRRVFAQTMAVNTASRRAMEKAGLKLVRTFHEEWPHPIEGAEHGEVEYALTWAGWKQGAAEHGPSGNSRPIRQEA